MKKIYLSILMAFSFFSTIFAANIVVTNNGDSGAGTLRQAIADAVDGDEITFNLSSGNETITILSELSISKTITIDGSNTAGSGTPISVQVTTPGTSSYRVFNIDATAKTISISYIEMKGGDVGSYNGGVINLTGGSLELNNCTLNSGHASNGGGLAIWADPNPCSVSLTECTVSGNYADKYYTYGAGIYSYKGDLVIKRSLIANNVLDPGYSGSGGGIIVNSSDLIIENSTIVDNTGEGVNASNWDNNNSVYIINSTISGNSEEGFAYAGSKNYIFNSTIVNNNLYDLYFFTGAVYAYYSWYNTTSVSINTQADAPNTTTTYTAGDLLALADNGGPTQTVAVAETAPAFENGSFAYYNATDGYYFQDDNSTWHKLTNWASAPTNSEGDKITTDQRGETRGDPPTMGAYQEAAGPSNYYRTASTGNWSSLSTWELSTDQTSWDPATETPNASNSAGITVNHNVSVDTDVSIDQTTVESGATLTVPVGVTLTVADGSDTDLTVDGALVINGTISTGTGAVDINPGGAIDASSGSVTFTDAGFLYLGGTVTSLGTFTKSTSTVSYDATSVQTVHPLSYYKLELSGGDKYFSPGTTKVDQKIDIDYSVVLGGMGTAETVTIQVTDPGITVSRLFNIAASGENVTIQNMTLKGGNTGSSTGAYGGVIALAGGSLSLTNCVVSSGIANQGGGLHLANNTCSATITGCTFSDNTASGGSSYPPFGGGICSNYGNLIIKNSLIANNSKVGSGGMGAGISINNANITIENSTVADNTGTGVDLETGTTANIVNTTISGNTGDGLNCSGGDQYITNTIMINNGSNDIRIVYVTPYIYYSWYDVNKVQIYQSGGVGGINDQTDAPNITTAYTTGDLLALADNGGSTQTMAVAETAPAVGNGAFAYYNATDGYYFQDDNNNWHKLTDWSSAPTNSESDKITTDQRGETRGTPPTIGSYESAVPLVTPSTQATSVSFTNTACSEITFEWTQGNGSKRAVFIKEEATIGTASPSDETTYSASTTFGNGTQIGNSGWYCVYNGTGTEVTVTGLSDETNYRVHVCEYNGNEGEELYNSSSSTNNPSNKETLTAFSAGSIETTGETVCYLGDPIVIGSIIDANGGDENISYKWQYASGEAFTNPFDISNSNSPTFDPPAGADMTYWYRRLAKDESCNTDFTPSEGNWKVTVLNAFVVGSISGDQTFCESGTPDEFAGIPPTGGSTPYSYQWQSSTDGVNFTDISGANELNYQAGEISDTTYFRLQQTSADGCGSEFTNTIAVYIHFLCCDELDNYCQSPDIENTEAYVSDESGPTIIFDNFWGVTDGITNIEWWGTTEDGSGIYCEENPKQFKITFYNDDNGSPGTSYQNASYDVSVTGTYTGSHFGPNNNPVIHYEFKLTPAFSGLTNGWVSIEGYPGGSCKFAWLTSSNGDGLSYINGSKNVSNKDFSFGLKFSPTIPIDNWALYLSFVLIALFIILRTYKPFS